MSKFKTTERGFKIYGEFIDRYKSEVRVQESSLTGAPCAWVFANNATIDEPSPHLTVDQAKELILALAAFVTDASDDDNWRNAPEYKSAWRQDEEDGT